MNESFSDNPESNNPAHPERVVIEDYRGPAADMPQSVPQDRQIAASPDTKPKLDTISQADESASAVDWPAALAKLGVMIGGGAAGGLLLPLFSLITLPSSHRHFDSVLPGTGVFLVAIAILGFAISTMALLYCRSSRNARVTQFGGRLGLALSSLALLIAALGYFLGW